MNQITTVEDTIDKEMKETGLTETEMEKEFGEALMKKGLARGHRH